jgi:hypothetical protein
MKISLKAISIGFILFCLSFQTVPAVTFDFSGTATGYSGNNILYVNVTESSIPELKGETEVLLPQVAPRYILEFIVDKELSFEYLGHDISGNLISNAYFSGVSLQELDTGGPSY